MAARVQAVGDPTRRARSGSWTVGGQFAATTHAEPELSLTAPKVTSRGRTTNVTLPDGTVATRTSQSKIYTHAVVLSSEIPELVIANREAQCFPRSRQIAMLLVVTADYG